MLPIFTLIAMQGQAIPDLGKPYPANSPFVPGWLIFVLLGIVIYFVVRVRIELKKDKRKYD